ncbi:MAG: SprT-like domain-containing protein [Planctomycetia bacterium]|nr:SprT-like domain-containing protein [Planctomycetia bacterium]
MVVRAAWLPRTTLGECVRRPQRFVVRLNMAMSESMAVETLCHEWAHALAWNYSLDKLARQADVSPQEFDLASHDEAWGCAYSRVWRAYVAISEAP